jgi:hypothetical protein
MEMIDEAEEVILPMVFHSIVRDGNTSSISMVVIFQ